MVRGALFLLGLITLIFLLALSFEPYIRSSADWLIENFGMLGISITVFVADLIISPIPPDAALFFIGKSQLHSQWMFWVPLLGMVSTSAGICGWFIGRRLQHLSFVKKFVSHFGDEHRAAIKRFGFWMVILGALTPLPFSLTCWLAGIFKLNFKTFLTASFFRIPRFVLYYWAIFYSGEIGSMLRNLF